MHAGMPNRHIAGYKGSLAGKLAAAGEAELQKISSTLRAKYALV
jgi:hypothetical protein